jgi:glucosamine-6-phosphate deaminase
MMGSGLRIVTVEDEVAMGERAAQIIADVVAQRPGAALSVPTGSTPIPMFQELARRVEEGSLDLSNIQLFCLDEYVGVETTHPKSLTGFLREHFLGPARVPEERVHTLPVNEPDLDDGAGRYEAEIERAGGLELAVLGLGSNGHIAYNEPGSAADSRTRVIALTPESIAQAEGYFGEWDVPTQAMTVGVETLLEARQIVLIVSGEAKADILAQVVNGPMTAHVPGSWFQLAGDRLTVIADRGAASKLT